MLKKNNRIIQTWVKGSTIGFQFSNKQWIQGNIKDIIKDSLLIDIIVERRYINQWGLIATDIGSGGLLKLHVKEIYSVPKKNKNVSIFTNGALYQLGGAAYMFLNIANSLIKNEQVFSARNLSRIGIAAGVFAFGTILSLTHKDNVVLGKKYTMQVLHTATEQ